VQRLSDRRPYKPPDFRGARRRARRELRERGKFELVGRDEGSLVITHLRADYRTGGLGMFRIKVRGKEIMLS
jgi:hypothetical protein